MKLLSPFRLSLLSLAFIGVIVLLLSLQNQSAPQTSLLQQTVILDESMTAVKAKRFNKGLLSQTLTLQTWTRNKGENKIHLEKPMLITFQKDGCQWQISSMQGEGYQQRAHGPLEKLELYQEVSLSSFDKQRLQEWQLHTDFLSYNPGNKTALTDHEVMIHGPEITMHAQGMSADLNQHTVEFLHKVKAHYASAKI